MMIDLPNLGRAPISDHPAHELYGGTANSIIETGNVSQARDPEADRFQFTAALRQLLSFRGVETVGLSTEAGLDVASGIPSQDHQGRPGASPRQAEGLAHQSERGGRR